MRETDPDSIGSPNKVVEADETYVGGKSKNRKNKVPKKEAVVSLVERDDSVRSHLVKAVSGVLLPSMKPRRQAH